MHLMPAQGLISSSLQYGVVSRSLPFTGRILRGYLDAAGTAGFGIGNPNTEFTPNIAACALGSDGGTAKILWGFRNGEVAFTSANKAMDAGSRSAAKFSRCAVGEEHHGAVLDVIWDGANAVTGGGDGRVKIWDSKKVQCVWTSEGRAPEECIKVASALSKGVIAAAMRSGDIIVWSGLASEMPVDPISVDVVVISCPKHDAGASHEISGLFIDSCGPSPTLLVTFSENHLFYRFDIDFSTGVVECATFGDPALGAITSVAPFFTNQQGELSLIVTGTQLGCVAIYDWTDPAISSPTYKFEAYEDGASVSALAWNGLVLVTGCVRGTTKVWDALTLEHLRTFPSPVPRKRASASVLVGAMPAEDPSVRQIVLGPEKEVLLVAVGDRVMAWRAGPVPKGGFRTRSTPGKKKGRAVTSKYHQQLEMNQAIVESRHLLDEESAHVQRAYGREREQRARLETLGLDEVEAVEYVLMLSREEAIEREAGASVQAIDEGVFEGDFDDIDGMSLNNPVPRRLSPSSSPPSSAASSPPRTLVSPPASPPRASGVEARSGRPIPRASGSNSKIQISPPLRAEPTEALFTPSPPATAPAAAHFPPITSSASPRGSAAAKSAWSTPLARSPMPSPGTSVSSGGRVSRAPSSTVGFTAKPVDEEDMDDDLRLAIELSLAETLSRESS
ncbi:WD40-repeat-containing domain protein [Mycena alexandri]|uniref:WD40-repeat-containing domain protein n=1 Tax=Mycena alexandri TaxID=1745969 RepID=A0AAD6TG10_9AGAR|nr:WD40-repeat-containing domain protein [Mycena alexandri]